jgi:hypothetical protein
MAGEPDSRATMQGMMSSLDCIIFLDLVDFSMEQR